MGTLPINKVDKLAANKLGKIIVSEIRIESKNLRTAFLE